MKNNCFKNNNESSFMGLFKGIICILLIITFSCESNGGQFSKGGVSFSYAPGWSITDQEEINDGGYYLSIEKDGFEESGLITVTYLEDSLELYSYMQLLQINYQDEMHFEDHKFNTIREGEFNGIDCISSKFTFNALGLEYKGVLYVLVSENKTFSLLFQEAIEDTSINKEGFKTVKSTFRIG